MTRIGAITTAAAMTLFLGVPAETRAQQPDTRDRTIMTFSAPVELPGIRLEAGTYVFRLADTATRNVIQVLRHDEMEMLGQWLFIPVERREVTSETIVTFRETSAGSTPAVQYWFYPGETIGKEFIYPKDQAIRIARRTGATVLTEDGPVTADARASADLRVAPAQEQGAIATRREDIGVVEGSGLPEAEPEPQATTGTAQATGPGTGRETTGTATARQDAQQGSTVQEESTARGFAQDELPQTASPLVMAGLIAVLSLAGAAAFRRFRP
ncbi:MAG: hypothetical protein HYY76_13145 [Acidobacteria bacterium]|nr:hypothetical protein [Acidobacteriota bacterium]